MRTLIHAAVAAGLALFPVSASDAAKRTHRNDKAHVSRTIEASPGVAVGNGAAAGNNANSMGGSNSAVENANGRSNCC
jgi:hypothetical protein